MDLRQFGKYNQFKILKQDAIKEVTRYVGIQSTSCHLHVTNFTRIRIYLILTKIDFRYDCCPLPLVKLKFHFTLKREFVVDPNLGRINNPDDNFP